MSSSHSVAEKDYSPFPPEDDALVGCETPGEIEAAIEEAAKPPDTEPSSCPYDGGTFRVSSDGVVYIKGDRKTRVCSELRIAAHTRDGSSRAWGLLLRWHDRDGQPHEWPVPSESLYGESDVLRELASRGLGITHAPLLRSYLQNWQTSKRARCVQKLGWYGASFVTPEGTIGERGAEPIIFQPDAPVEPEYGTAGTWEQWRDTVAALAAGNTRLALAISAAFAGPLLVLTEEDSGGLHLVGASSSGKTTALRVAASVWGNPKAFVRQWRATANGLEGLAAIHNDSLLCLDELSQIDPRQAGEAAYMLANGKGKARASRSGIARPSASWRLLLLSSGEQRLGDVVAECGKRVKAGQEIRLVDVPADTESGMGIVERLNGLPSAAAFVDAVRTAVITHYGAVGREWLRRIVSDDRAALVKVLKDGVEQFVAEAVLGDAGAQAKRVGRRFGLVAAAGDLAAHYGLTGWQEHEASDCVRACFQAWLNDFGSGSREDAALLAQVRAFFEKHGASRFQDIKEENETVYNRVGFWRQAADDSREYIVPCESFKMEVVKGYDVRHACAVLEKAGMLIPDKDRSSHKQRLPGSKGTRRVYVLVLAGTEVEE